MLGPASTDAVNRASRLSYGEATGITQTVRNYAASLGLAILGTIAVAQFKTHLVTSFIAHGMHRAMANAEASAFSQSQGGSGSTAAIPRYIRLDFAYATRSVFYVMAGIMAVAAVVAFLGLRPGVQGEPDESEDSAGAVSEGAEAGRGNLPEPQGGVA